MIDKTAFEQIFDSFKQKLISTKNRKTKNKTMEVTNTLANFLYHTSPRKRTNLALRQIMNFSNQVLINSHANES